MRQGRGVLAGGGQDRARRAAPQKGPSATARELQRVAARGWPALETEPLGEWTLRASGGFTRRANSVLPLGDPGVPLDTALERIGQWYAARGLPPVIVVATGRADADEELAAALAERGWADERHTRVRIMGLAPLADTGTAAPPGSAGEALPASACPGNRTRTGWRCTTGPAGPTGPARPHGTP